MQLMKEKKVQMEEVVKTHNKILKEKFNMEQTIDPEHERRNGAPWGLQLNHGDCTSLPFLSFLSM